MKKTSLKEAVVAITYRCNARCRMCNIWKIKNHKKEIMPEDFLNLPRQLVDINITGGEPFLRKDLEKIIKIIKNRCSQANIIISSNGFATDLIIAQMKKIIKIKPDIGIAISIDGIGEKHSEIRGIEKGYEKVLVTLKSLKALGVKNLKIGFTLGDYNTEELSRVYALAKSLEAEFSLSIVHSSENYFGKENKIRNKKVLLRQLNKLIDSEISTWNYKRWGRAYFAYGAMEFIKTGKRILPDYSGILNIFIDPRGDIYPCDVSSRKIGNLRSFNNLGKCDHIEPDIKCRKSWMVCTARQSIKKHWLKVGLWIIQKKFLRLNF